MHPHQIPTHSSIHSSHSTIHQLHLFISPHSLDLVMPLDVKRLGNQGQMMLQEKRNDWNPATFPQSLLKLFSLRTYLNTCNSKTLSKFHIPPLSFMPRLPHWSLTRWLLGIIKSKKHHAPNLPVTFSAHLGPGNYLFLYPHPYFELQPGVKLQPWYDVCAPGLVYILVCPGPTWPKTSPVPFSKNIQLKNMSSNWEGKQPNI